MSHQTNVNYIVANGQQEFDLAIPYLDRSHIKVAVNGVIPAYSWVSASRIRLTFPTPDGSVVNIRRETPIDRPLVEFTNSSNLTQEELNRGYLHTLYRQQEQDDFISGSLEQARVRLGEQLGVVTDPDAILDELIRVSDLGADALNRFRDALAAIDLSAERILEQSFQLTDQAFRTDTLDGIVANTTARTDDLELRVETITDLVDALANLENGTGLATIIQNEAAERVAGDTALASTLALIGAKNAGNNAFVLNLNSVRVSGSESLAQRLAAITTKANDNEAKILAEETARATAVSAEANRINALITRVGDAETSITNEATARTTADASFAQTIALIGARNANNTGFILDLNKVLVGPTESFLTRLNQLVATAGTNAQALVTSEATARATEDQSLGQRIDSVGTKTDNNTAAITAEQTARTNAISAEASARQALATKVANDIAAAVLVEANARSAADLAEAQARQSLATTVGQNSSAIQNEATARSNADAAIAQQFAVLGAFRNGQTAFVLDLNKVEVGAGYSLGTRLSGIDTTINGVSASVVNETTARVNADSALSQSITNLSNTVGGNTASITQLFQVTNGLNARAGLSLNVNGHITGWLLNNNGSSGQFAVVADNFTVNAPNGGTPVQPFIVSAGRARFNGNVDIYGDLLVTGTIHNGKIQKDTITGLSATYQSATMNLTGSSPAVVANVWLAVEGNGTPVLVDFNSWLHLRHDPGGTFNTYFEIRRQSQATHSYMQGDYDWEGNYYEYEVTAPVVDQQIVFHTIEGNGMGNDNYQGPETLKVLDRPGPGTWQYIVRAWNSVNNMTIQRASIRYLSATEYKTNSNQ